MATASDKTMKASEYEISLDSISGSEEYIFRAKLEGVTSLLMSHPRGMEPDDNTIKSSRSKKAVLTAEQVAEARVYRDPLGALYVPVMAVGRALIEAGKSFQDPANKRATLTKAFAGSIFLPDYEGFTLTRDGDPIVDYEVDTRRAVNKTTRGAILVSRPRVEAPWELAVEFAVDPDLLLPDTVARALAIAGKRIGLLAFRPEKLGNFGKFKLVQATQEGYGG
jgi:hypothetical protein